MATKRPLSPGPLNPPEPNASKEYKRDAESDSSDNHCFDLEDAVAVLGKYLESKGLGRPSKDDIPIPGEWWNRINRSQELEQMLSQTDLGLLTRLDVSFNVLTTNCVSIIAKWCPQMTALRTLSIAHNSCWGKPEDIVTILTACPNCTLDVHDSGYAFDKQTLDMVINIPNGLSRFVFLSQDTHRPRRLGLSRAQQGIVMEAHEKYWHCPENACITCAALKQHPD